MRSLLPTGTSELPSYLAANLAASDLQRDHKGNGIDMSPYRV